MQLCLLVFVAFTEVYIRFRLRLNRLNFRLNLRLNLRFKLRIRLIIRLMIRIKPIFECAYENLLTFTKHGNLSEINYKYTK